MKKLFQKSAPDRSKLSGSCPKLEGVDQNKWHAVDRHQRQGSFFRGDILGK
jgi:hypothetical protein